MTKNDISRCGTSIVDTLLIRQIENRDFTMSHKFTPAGVFQEGAR